MHIQAYKLIEQIVGRLKDGDLVCDVGSYDVNGSLKPIFEKQIYTGVDIAAGPNVDVVAPDPKAMPFDDETFDCVVSSSCLEHVAYPHEWAKEVIRILKPGGWFAITAPHTIHYHNPPHYWNIRKDALTLLFSDLLDIEVCEEAQIDSYLIGRKKI